MNNRYLLYRLKIGLFLTIIPVVIIMCGQRTSGEDYVARFDNHYLSVREVKDHFSSVPSINRTSVENFVNEWLENEMLYQLALKSNIQHEESINRKVEEYRKRLIVDYYKRYLLQEKVSISNEEIRNYYEENKLSFTRDREQAKILHFVVPELSTAREIKKILTRRRSSQIDKTIQEYNGVYSVVTRNELLPELNGSIFSTRALGVVGPIETRFGFHVISIIERYPKGSILPISSVRDEIINRLTIIKQRNFFENFIDSLKSSKDYEINYERLTEIFQENK